MRPWTTWIARLLLLVLAACAGEALAAPETGWWWNPNESGRGFFVESHDGVTFIGAYLYDADGHALWLVAGGANADPYNYTGPLYTESGGQTLFGGYVAPAAPTAVGAITVHFIDDTHGTVTWPGGVVQIQRQVFGTGGRNFQPRSGWWWNPNESGTGYSLEVQGNNLFVVGFMYEDGGRPVWYFSAGPMASDTSYKGNVIRFSGGQTMAGPYQPPVASPTLATVDIEFDSVASAHLTFSSATATAAGVKNTTTRTDDIIPQFEQLYVPPPHFAGALSLTAHQTVDASPLHNDIQITVTGTVAFTRGGNPGPLDTAEYNTTKTTFQATLYEVQSAPDSTCILQATTQDVPAVGVMEVSPSGLYNYHISFNITYFASGTCTDSTGTHAIGPEPFPWSFTTREFEGAIFDDIAKSSDFVTTSPYPGFTEVVDWEWAFQAGRTP